MVSTPSCRPGGNRWKSSIRYEHQADDPPRPLTFGPLTCIGQWNLGSMSRSLVQVLVYSASNIQVQHDPI